MNKFIEANKYAIENATPSLLIEMKRIVILRLDLMRDDRIAFPDDLKAEELVEFENFIQAVLDEKHVPLQSPGFLFGSKPIGMLVTQWEQWNENWGDKDKFLLERVVDGIRINTQALVSHSVTEDLLSELQHYGWTLVWDPRLG